MSAATTPAAAAPPPYEVFLIDLTTYRPTLRCPATNTFRVVTADEVRALASRPPGPDEPDRRRLADAMTKCAWLLDAHYAKRF